MSNDLGLDFEIVSNALMDMSSDLNILLTIQKTKLANRSYFIDEGKNRRRLVLNET